MKRSKDKQYRKTTLWYLFLALNMILFSTRAQSQTWIQDTYKDFIAGELGISGQNLFVSHNGTIRTIHRFDLNNDGYIDLLFNSTHDYDYAVPATIMTMSGHRKMNISNLAVNGSLKVEVFDLNRDGYSDLVFCPNASGIQNSRRFITIIWGRADGWSSKRSSRLLPVHGVKDIAIADLNYDGWPDIITLNSKTWLPDQPNGNIIRVYWGGAKGFILTRFEDVGVEGAFRLASGDFDSDGVLDVAALSEHNVVHILWATNHEKADSINQVPAKIDSTIVELPDNRAYYCIRSSDINADGRLELVVGSNKGVYVLKNEGRGSWRLMESVSDVAASSITVNDIDNDGSPDLIISSSLVNPQEGGGMDESKTIANKSKIMWGNNGYFSKTRITTLDAPYSVATAVIDLDGDGYKDVVCAIGHGEKTYEAESVIFFGKGDRGFKRSLKGIPSKGANSVTAIPSNRSQPATVIICNRMAGTLFEKVPLYLYWGGAMGFNADKLTKIPFESGYQSSAADINGDGYVDLISMNSMHGGSGRDSHGGANIFWGSENGFNFKSPTVLHEENAATCNIADLNKDGYLDLVIGFFEHPDKTPTDLIIYYGSKGGFRLNDRVVVACAGRSTSPTIADFNKDGWLDIAVCSYSKDLLRIFRGGPNGFKEKNQQTILVPSIIDLETADFNKDGYLDIVACSYGDKVNHHHDTGVKILWGSEKGFTHWNAQWLPGFTPLGPVVADFDNDGYLDLFCPSYLQDLTRESLPMFLYWGGPNGFTSDRKTTLIGNSSSDALAADFNQDGRIDLAVAAHTTDGYHSKAMSKVYYNDNKRFKSQSMQVKYLPSPGCHWMWNVDMGNIYNRKWEEAYESSIFHWNRSGKMGMIIYSANIPKGATLTFAIKSAATKSALNHASWRRVEKGEFKIRPQDRFLQYKVIFGSDNGDLFPILDKVIIKLQ